MIIRTLARKPGIKDKNIQVVKAKLELIRIVVCSLNSRVTASLGNALLSDVIESVGEAKVAEVRPNMCLMIFLNNQQESYTFSSSF